ncbi:alpha/beta hydrolase [Autumnicola edwardsiae]|uniref:Alpha/beta hydrolase n=1 Tax=Autumnicola edwardsiae TaxID=3075594 RepID=A0ABU3CWY4_9FLAO|nr:alpha/beta hydrolase [Zunongwangia sp. F297]MDT0650883.1 alpha/beta hydrolase [Zunongwangia sp. F297]
MNKIIIVLFLTLFGNTVLAQELEIQTFGNQNNKALIFLHGGPGYNSVPFEQVTANELANNGFFVISYDRRGEGRNENLKAEYTFTQTLEDLNKIYQKYQLKKATLVGHSFGGIIATIYADKYSDKINNLILVSTPISMQETFKNIIASSKEIYTEKDDKVNLNYISMLENMDSTSLEYATYSFMHAMSNGFYSAKNPNQKAVELYQKFKTDTLLKKYASKNEYLAPQKFWENEQYTSISIKKNLESLQNKNVSIFGLYGKEDGLYSKEQIASLEHILGNEKVKYLENCSHNVFIDRQDEFIDSVKKWTN